MSKPQPQLSDMPWNVLRDIAVHCPPSTRMALRSCSRVLRDAVDHAPGSFDSVRFIFNSNNTQMEVRIGDERKLVRVHKEDVGCRIKYHTEQKGVGQKERVLDGEHFVQKPLGDFARLVRNPLTRIAKLEFVGHHYYRTMPKGLCLLKEMRAIRGNMKRKLRVEELVCQVMMEVDELMELLTYFDPNTCKTLKVTYSRDADDTELMKMAICKNVETVWNLA